MVPQEEAGRIKVAHVVVSATATATALKLEHDMTESSPRRIVLRPTVTDDDVVYFAYELDWHPTEAPHPESGASVEVWRSDAGAEIRHVDDRPIGMRYLYVRGAAAETVERQIRAACDTWTLADALSFAREATERDDKLTAVYAIALTARQDETEAAVEQLREMAHDPDPGVRQAVIIATGYVGWPDLVQVAEEIHRNDPVDFVRDNAGILLEGLRRYGAS